MIGGPTLQSTLFRSFSAVILTIMVLLIGYFFVYTRRVLLEHSTEAIEEIARVISADQDEEIRRLDVVSINAAYSEMVTEGFQSYLQSSGETSLQSRRTLAGAITAIVGPQVPVKQFYLYDFDGNRLSVGMINNSERVQLGSMPWYESVVQADGRKVLSGPSVDQTLSAAYVNQRDRLNILVHRLFFDRYRTPVGIMELVQDSAKVFNSAAGYQTREDAQVFVLDGQGKLLFPSYSPPVIAPEMMTGITEANRSEGSFLYQTDGGPRLAAFTASAYTGWTTVVSQDKSLLLAESNAFTVLTLAVILPALLAVLAVSFLVSRRITRPLRVIHETIEGLDLVSISNGQPAGNMHLNELESLRQAVVTMQAKLRTSLAETIAAHRHESQARMQALQAQVNPHFLHNTINTLSAMAEEHMYDDIVSMCRNVSTMMRYVADQQQTVSLQDELEYSRSYLQTMKLRFRDQLDYEVTVDGDSAAVPIPRLVIQPLVENSIKHGTTRRSPWTVGVVARIGQGSWTTTIRDNGPGFSNDMLARLNQWEPGDGGSVDPGVGITNILRRMSLWYGSAGFTFSVNQVEHGAEVTIGGPLNPNPGQGDRSGPTDE
jgi:two-component system, sensor histidine kinase YesM